MKAATFSKGATVTIRVSSLRLMTLIAFASVALTSSSVVSAGVLRVANWNMGNRPNDAADRSDLGTVFDYIGDYAVTGTARPFDILVMSESDTTSAPDTAATARTTYGVATYTSVVSAADGGGDRTGFVYNAASVQLLGTADLDGGALTHNALRGQFRPVGTTGAADFYVCAVHLKSGTANADKAARTSEAQFLRADADALGDAAIIFGGDFNWLGADERGANPIVSAWDVFAASGNGQVSDPVGQVGEWRDNATYKALHTNDPGGAMDDRFDMQLISGELTDAVGLDYVTGSYNVIGNDGTHALNGSILTGTGAPTEVLAALHDFSDHLPVMADYSFTAHVPEPTAMSLIVVVACATLRRRRWIAIAS